MSASISIRCRLDGAVMVIALAMGCLQASAAEPRRPPSVPARAVWIGGPDGGVFVLLRATGAPGYSGKIYYPDGAIWYAGAFRLRPSRAKPFDPHDTQRLSGWDGTRLLIDDGRTLETVPARPPK